MKKFLTLSLFLCFFLNYSLLTAQMVELNAIGKNKKSSALPYDFFYAVSYSNGNSAYIASGHEYIGASGVGDCDVGVDKIFLFTDSDLSWQYIADLPGPQYNEAVVYMNGTHYLFSNHFLWKYDSLASAWQSMASLPSAPLYQYSHLVINDKFYVFCGNDSTGMQNNLWEYDPSNNLWSSKAAFPGVGRFNAIAWSINGYGYAGLGYYTGSYVDLYKYDPINDQWTTCSNFPDTNNTQIFFSIDSIGYIHTDQKFWSYSPATDQWLLKNNFSASVYFALAFSSNGFGYLKSSSDFEKYNPVTDQWTSIPEEYFSDIAPYKGVTMNNKAFFKNCSYDPVQDHWQKDSMNAEWLFSYNNKGYAYYNGQFEEFDPSSISWTMKTQPPSNFSLTSKCVFSLNGKGYFLTPSGYPNYDNLFWNYDIASNQWHFIDTLHFLTLSDGYSFEINNIGYYGLGPDDSLGDYSDKFFKYDPSINQWSPIADFPGGGKVTAFAIAANSKGYAGLGKYDPTDDENDGNIYEYDPVSNSWQLITTFFSPRTPYRYCATNGTFQLGSGYRRVSQHCGGISFDDFFTFVPTTVNILSQHYDNNISVFPNPMEDHTMVQFENKSSGSYIIALSDFTGRVIRNYGKVTAAELSIDRGSLEAGGYIVQIQEVKTGRIISKKLIII